MRDRDGDLQVWCEMLSHGVKLLVLEEPLTRAALLELPEHRQAEELVVLVGARGANSYNDF